MKPSEVFPDGWLDVFLPDKPIAFGQDIGTTEGKKSNPSCFAIAQEVGLDIFLRLIIRYKSQDPAVTIQIIEHALKGLKGIPNRGLAIDATSEKFFAADVERHFMGRLVVAKVVASENYEYKGTKMLYKVYCGNLLVNRYTDALIGMPKCDWLEKDFRSVQRSAGSFTAEVGEDGGHADCFDGAKLSVFQLVTGNEGTAEAQAVSTGFTEKTGSKRSFWKPDHEEDFQIKEGRSAL
jgi:hypothetical protein